MRRELVRVVVVVVVLWCCGVVRHSVHMVRREREVVRTRTKKQLGAPAVQQAGRDCGALLSSPLHSPDSQGACAVLAPPGRENTFIVVPAWH